DEMGGHDKHKIDHENDAVRPALVLEGGEKRWPPPPMKVQAPSAPPPPKPAPVVVAAPPKPAKTSGHHGPAPTAPTRASGIVLSIIGLVAAAAWIGLRLSNPDALGSPETTELISRFT